MGNDHHHHHLLLLTLPHWTCERIRLKTGLCFGIFRRRCTLLIGGLFRGSWKRKFLLQVNTRCILVGRRYNDHCRLRWHDVWTLLPTLNSTTKYYLNPLIDSFINWLIDWLINYLIDYIIPSDATKMPLFVSVASLLLSTYLTKINHSYRC